MQGCKQNNTNVGLGNSMLNSGGKHGLCSCYFTKGIFWIYLKQLLFIYFLDILRFRLFVSGVTDLKSHVSDHEPRFLSQKYDNFFGSEKKGRRQM